MTQKDQEPRGLSPTLIKEKNWRNVPGWILELLQTSDTCASFVFPLFLMRVPTAVMLYLSHYFMSGAWGTDRSCLKFPLSSRLLKLNGMVFKKMCPRKCTWGASRASWPDMDDEFLGCWYLIGMRLRGLQRGDGCILHGRGMSTVVARVEE